MIMYTTNVFTYDKHNFFWIQFCGYVVCPMETNNSYIQRYDGVSSEFCRRSESKQYFLEHLYQDVLW